MGACSITRAWAPPLVGNALPGEQGEEEAWEGRREDQLEGVTAVAQATRLGRPIFRPFPSPTSHRPSIPSSHLRQRTMQHDEGAEALAPPEESEGESGDLGLLEEEDQEEDPLTTGSARERRMIERRAR